MPTLYLDPTGNGTPWDTSGWSGSYTAIDEGTRAPTSHATDEMSCYTEGKRATVTFTPPDNVATCTKIIAYTWNDQGVPEFELRINGTGYGNKSTRDGTNGSWYWYSWINFTALAFTSMTDLALIITCGSEEDDSLEAVYLEAYYTIPETSGSVAGAALTLLDDKHTMPFAGGFR